MTLPISWHVAPGNSLVAVMRYSRKLHNEPQSQPTEASDILKSIQATLSLRQVEKYSGNALSEGLAAGSHAELSWNRTVAILSEGGVITRQWNFDDEIRCCCFAFFESSGRSCYEEHFDPLNSLQLGDDDYSSSRTPFGPFTQFLRTTWSRARTRSPSQPKYRTSMSLVEVQQATCIILRSQLRVYERDGTNRIFPLPFLVKKAWALFPLGVLMERELDIGEARNSSVPLHFTVTDAVGDPKKIGCAHKIAYGPHRSPVIYQTDAVSPNTDFKRVMSPSVHENVVCVAPPSASECSIIVTHNRVTRVLTVWHYAFVRVDHVIPVRTREVDESHGPSDDDFFSWQSPSLTGKMGGLELHAGGTAEMRPDTRERPHVEYWWQPIFSLSVSEHSSHTVDCILFKQAECSVNLAILLPFQQLAIVAITKESGGGEDYLVASLTQQVPATSVAPILYKRQCDMLILRPDHSLCIFTDGGRVLDIELAKRNSFQAARDGGMVLDWPGDHPLKPVLGNSPIVALKDAIHRSSTLMLANGTEGRISIDLHPRNEVTQLALFALQCAMPAEEHFALRTGFLSRWAARGRAGTIHQEFSCLSAALMGLITGHDRSSRIGSSFTSSEPWSSLVAHPAHMRLKDDVVLRSIELPHLNGSRPISSQPHSGSRTSILAPALFALHIIGQSLMMDLERRVDLFCLASLVIQLARMAYPDWADYWARICPDAENAWEQHEMQHGFFDARLPPIPPDILTYLFNILSDPSSQYSWTTLRDLPSVFGYELGKDVVSAENPLSIAGQVMEVYHSIRDTQASSARQRAEVIVIAMVRHGITQETLHRIPYGVVAPLREALRTCQLHPPPNWPAEAYLLIDRKDLAQMAVEGPPVFGFGFGDASHEKNPLELERDRRTIYDLTQEVAITSDLPKGTSTADIQLSHFTAVRFGTDRRLQEACLMLQSSRIPSIHIPEKLETNEHDISKEYQNIVFKVADRTWALSVGRGMLTFGSMSTPSTDARVVPKIELSIRIMPQNTILTPDSSKLLSMADSKGWADFHNAAAAGLRISPLSKEVDSSWIQFIRPVEMTPEHAGYLLALGLTGHLTSLMTWHMFSYLTPKHEHTSIGILLGLSAARLGTGSHHVLKILAVHMPGLLPTRHIDLNVPLITQSAALIGLGLLFFGTGNRHYAGLALNEISRRDLFQPTMGNEHREAAALSAALAFGMIMIGKGSSSVGLVDMELVSQLRLLIHGDTHNYLPKKQTNNPFDLNLTSPGSTLALALMFIKTNRVDIAELLAVPNTALGLSQIPPHFLLLRTLGRSIILWDSIVPSIDWVTSQVPRPSTVGGEASGSHNVLKDGLDLAEYNVTAGACFALALKFAGTASEAAYLVVLHFYDKFFALQGQNSPAYNHRIKKAALREGLNLLSISLAMIMAGTGEVNCLRRLRYAHGQVGTFGRYGSHMATHMAMGLLFLGGGRYTLGTSDLAIAAMITAFYPRFPSAANDNRGYLQALRHLWVIAAEPRCLIARDVDTGDIVYLPIKIKIREGLDLRSNQLLCPTLVPNLDILRSIRVDSPRYWGFTLDLDQESHKAALLRHQTLFVKRRTGFLGYKEDPRGCRSIFVRSGAAAGDGGLLDFPLALDTIPNSVNELHHFIMSFSNDPRFLTFADRLCRHVGDAPTDKAFYAFAQAALLECLTLDKPQLLQSHLWIHHTRMLDPSTLQTLAIRDIKFAEYFYSHIFENMFAEHVDSILRAPLIRPSFILATLLTLHQQLQGVCSDSISPFDHFLLHDRNVLSEDRASPETIKKVMALILTKENIPAGGTLRVMRRLIDTTYSSCVNLTALGGSSQELQTPAHGLESVANLATTLFGSDGFEQWTRASTRNYFDSLKLLDVE